MGNQAHESLEKFLNPQTLRANLIAASLFITSYEILKDSVIDQIKSFYRLGFDENDPVVRGPYEQDVLALDKKGKVFAASVAWLKANDVIDEADEQSIIDLTDHRNKLAHQLPEFLTESGKDVEVRRLESLVTLVAKIDRWWIINVEVTDPNAIDPNRITSGRVILLQMLFETATATDSTDLYRKFLELRATQSRQPAK